MRTVVVLYINFVTHMLFRVVEESDENFLWVAKLHLTVTKSAVLFLASNANTQIKIPPTPCTVRAYDGHPSV